MLDSEDIPGAFTAVQGLLLGFLAGCRSEACRVLGSKLVGSMSLDAVH